MKRATYNWLGGVGATIVAAWSLRQALDPASTFLGLDHKALGQCLLGIWVFAPPVFFWVDWVYFCRGLSKEQLEVAKHTHDLSRNIWLALVAILAVIFEIKLAP